MRCVFLRQIPGQGISRHGTQERRDEDQPAPPPEHCCVILEAQLSVFYHFSFVPLARPAAPLFHGKGAVMPVQTDEDLVSRQALPAHDPRADWSVGTFELREITHERIRPVPDGPAALHPAIPSVKSLI